MGFLHKFGQKLHKLGNKLDKGIHQVGKFGVKFGHFVEKKALPIAKSLTKSLDNTLKIATPIVGAVAPEFLPLVVGAEMATKQARRGFRSVDKGIKAVKQINEGVKLARNNPLVG
jgi:hypothetical protein